MNDITAGRWVELGRGEKINKRPKPIQMDIEPTPDIILRLIEYHKANELGRYKTLQNYYDGYSNIILRTKDDPSKPNNRLVSGYPSYIVDLMQGMIVGKPIAYTSTDDEALTELQEIFDYNDEQDENSELSKMAGIKGKAYEILYTDEESRVRFNEVDADNMIMVYDTKLIPEPNFAIRYYYTTDINNLNTEGTLNAILYTKTEVVEYIQGENGLIEVDRKGHTFKDVPVVEFLNNDEGIGDFERVISLIDAYEKAQSDTANDFEEFTDAFLVLQDMPGTTKDDVKELREEKILLTQDKQGAYWLIKEINDTALENYKNRLNQDIHKFAKVPDMGDENFAGNISGESMKYKLMAMDQVIAAKQRKFKRALQRRIELIFNHLQVHEKTYDYRDIDITFFNNKPINEKEKVEMAIQMLGITSKSTALAEIPAIDNVELELEKIEQEKAAYKDDRDTIDLDSIEDEEDE